MFWDKSFDTILDIIREFRISGDQFDSLKDANLIFAEYDNEGYEGSAIVIYERNGMFYQNHGSHCSCYGLEDQWSPLEVEYDVLLEQIKQSYYSNKEKMITALKEWKEQNEKI